MAAPTWYVVLLHMVTGPGILPALSAMAQAASAEHETAPDQERVSPDVYFISADSKAQKVAYDDGRGGIVLNTDGLLGGVLYGPSGLLREFE